MKLIEDLGMQLPTKTSKRKYRYGLFECPICLTHFRVMTKSVTSNHTTKCRKCSSSIQVKKAIDSFGEKISKESLRDAYNYADGKLFYKKKLSMNVEIGDKVGCANKLGYIRTKINGKSYGVHRLVWMYFNGDFKGDIDHIDHNPSNNRIENLRVVTHIENCRNRGMRSDNTSGVNGVMWNKTKNKWEVYLSNKYIGSFLKKQDAILCRTKVEKEAGYHKNHGKEV